MKKQNLDLKNLVPSSQNFSIGNLGLRRAWLATVPMSLQNLAWHPSPDKAWDVQAYSPAVINEQVDWWGSWSWNKSFAVFRYADRPLWSQLEVDGNCPGDVFLPCRALSTLSEAFRLQGSPLTLSEEPIAPEVRRLLILLENCVAHPCDSNWQRLRQNFLAYYRATPLAGACLLESRPAPLEVARQLFMAAATWRAACAG